LESIGNRNRGGKKKTEGGWHESTSLPPWRDLKTPNTESGDTGVAQTA